MGFPQRPLRFARKRSDVVNRPWSLAARATVPFIGLVLRRLLTVSLAAMASVGVSAVAGSSAAADPTTGGAVQDTIIPFLQKYCVACHGPDDQMAGIAVHELRSADQLLREFPTWERVYRMIRAGAMPPPKHDPFPGSDEQSRVIAVLDEALYHFDCSQIDHPGRPALRRLNRAEYNNTIRDLFGTDIRPADAFPQDDVGEGFDNIGDVLSLPPLLMDKYLDAAELVAATVLDLRDFSKPLHHSFVGGQLRSSLDTHPDSDGFVMLATNGQVEVEFDATADGMYHVAVEARADQAGDETARIILRVDGQPVTEFATEGRRSARYQHELTLTAGRHVIAAAFPNDFYNPEAEEGRRDRNLAVRAVEITGPEGGSAPAWHESHRRIAMVRPSDELSPRAAASQVLRPILRRAFRRPVSDDETDRYTELVEQQMTAHGETWDYGLAVALQAILVAPDFLFRREADPEPPALHRDLNDVEVAVRLSYFLWSSTPDEELLRLAELGQLRQPDVLRRQVQRLLNDERSVALSENFAAQWLNLRNLRDLRPNPEVYPEFDDALRAAMGQETSWFFRAMIREDRSVDEFLSGDFTYVNERLARHYRIDGISGDQFVRVSLAGTGRSGVLTHAGILTLTSNPGRTSPVKRGKWILENILGEAPPPAPPAVPQLEETAKASPDLSLREQLALHRADPGCASCHRTMDPLGFGLENFDAVGRWREQDGTRTIDASGELPSGERFTGAPGLVNILKARREQFHRALTERMMVYALGRGLGYYDRCAVNGVLSLLQQREFRFSSLIEGIVLSDPFLRRSRTRDPLPPDSPHPAP